MHPRFGGFATGQFGSGMHELVLRKDKFGEVRCHMRKSSASSSWLPEGEGYPVFKTIPTGHPILAEGKACHKWGREIVESTVRSWFRFMGLSPASETRVRSDWETRFSTLPVGVTANGGVDMEQLSEKLKLVWQDLPSFVPVRGHVAGVAGAAHGTSDEMENPPVNPITGPGRTVAVRDREVAAYRQRVRQSHRDAIFQSDYLFVWPPTKQLSLHRVVNGACMTDATSEEISFTTTEYEHSVQLGIAGFWGTFDLKPNPIYNSRDKATGSKFIRHQNMSKKVGT